MLAVQVIPKSFPEIKLVAGKYHLKATACSTPQARNVPVSLLGKTLKERERKQSPNWESGWENGRREAERGRNTNKCDHINVFFH